MHDEDEDELNPWGSPSEGRMNSSLVESLLMAVTAGAEVVKLMDSKNTARAVRVEKLWTLFSTAEGMLLREQGRGRRLAADREAAQKKLLGGPLVEDDEEDEYEGPDDSCSTF